MRLGRLPHDPSRLAVIPHLMATGAPPPEIVTPPEGFIPLLVRNDELPTCTIAGLINCARLWTLTKHGYDLATDEDLLLEFYARVAGCQVSEIAETQGLVMLDVLESAQRDGFRINSQNVLVPMFKRIETDDVLAMKDSVATTGSAYTGWDLRQCDMTSDWIGDVSSPAEGGHCAPEMGYHPGGFVDATWGVERPADDAWVLSRAAEAYSVSWTMEAA